MTKNINTPQQPIAAIATAPGPAALGIVRCSGEGCIFLVSKIFSRPKALLQAQGNTIVYGFLQEKASDNINDNINKATNKAKKIAKPQKIDQVLINVFKCPHSYTGQEMLEITCHGGPFIVQSVLNLLLKSGFKAATPGEFTMRAFLSGKIDLTRAEAIKEIIDTKSTYSRQKALSRLEGNLQNSIQKLKDRIVAVLAGIEALVEYPEDENAISNSFCDKELRAITNDLKTLSGTWQEEKLFQDGVQVVLCGKTNAGKSSLFNALLCESRAIVSDVAGTTRDYLESYASFCGIPVKLFDTAGLHETKDQIENAGISKTKDLSNQSDVVFYVVDATKGIQKDDVDFILSLKDQKIVLVFNKADLKNTNTSLQNTNDIQQNKTNCSNAITPILQECATQQAQDAIKNSIKDIVFTSCVTRQGLVQLKDTIKNIFLQDKKQDYSCNSCIGTQRQKDALDECILCLEHALTVQNDFALDAVALDIESALYSLQLITGEITTDDILDSVFSKFCLGK